jgi:hypothetical protein
MIYKLDSSKVMRGGNQLIIGLLEAVGDRIHQGVICTDQQNLCLLHDEAFYFFYNQYIQRLFRND